MDNWLDFFLIWVGFTIFFKITADLMRSGDG